MTDAPAMLDAALAYARKGCAVFPVVAGGKEPLTAHGFKDASNEADQIRAWWSRWPDANIGVATGPASGLTVLDLDAKHGDVSMMLADLEQLVGTDAPPTATAITGGGGLHLWFRIARVWSSGSRLGGRPGVDLKCAGGYVVAPPSLHKTGRRYAWHDEGENGLSAVPRAPADWLDAVCARAGWREAGEVTQGPGALDKVTWSARQPAPSARWAGWFPERVDRVVADVLAAAKGDRHGAIFKAACRLGDALRGVPPNEVERVGRDGAERLLAAAVTIKPEAGAPELERVIADAVQRGLNGGDSGKPEPDVGEVRRLWFARAPVAEDAEAAAYVASRGLTAEALDELGLAGVVGAGAALPGWAHYKGRSWAESGHRLIVPLYDAEGGCAGVAARILGMPAGGVEKSLVPAGLRLGGLVFADTAGLAMLRGAQTVREVWIVEGEIDTLTLAEADLDAVRKGQRKRRPRSMSWEHAPWAVLGVVKGAWNKRAGAALASRIPASALVLFATDNDGAGNDYALAAAETTQARGLCDRRLRVPAPYNDWNEWWTAPRRQQRGGA